MVTNLPPDVKAKWARAASVTNPKEKLILLREVLADVPKHKGTERLLASLKRQIKSLEEEIEEMKRSRRGKQSSLWSLKKEGDVLAAILGRATDCVIFHKWATGKEINLTHLFERPIYGVLRASGVTVQYALLAVEFEFSERRLRNLRSAAATSDILVILVDSALDNIIDLVREVMKGGNIVLRPRPVDLSITYVSGGGIRVVGTSDNFKREELLDMLRRHGLIHAIIRVSETTTLNDVEDALLRRTFKPMLLVSTRPTEQTSLFGIHDHSPEELAKKIIVSLNKMVVYIGEVSHKRPIRALLVNQGTNVKELFEVLFKASTPPPIWAKVRRESILRVGLDFRLQEGDIVELHT